MSFKQLVIFNIIFGALSCQEFNATEDLDAEYALHGVFSYYDDTNDLGLAFHLSIGLNCAFIKINMVSPACTDHWYAIGLGGDYTFESSSEELSFSAESSDEDFLDESVKMNGYAIISVNDDGRIFETTLNNTNIATYQPLSQTNNNLRDCSVTTENCVRKVECYRDFITNDDEDNDFNEFVLGLNSIIWAYGVYDSSTDTFIRHKFAKESFIELEGYHHNLCGYARSYLESLAVTDTTSDESVDAWKIIGIMDKMVIHGTLGLMYYCNIIMDRSE